MDIAACAVTSILGRFAWAYLEANFSRSLPLPSLKPISVFFIFFSAQYALVKAYRYLIYPYFRSGLRKLPGPRNHHFLLGQTLRQFFSGSPIEPYTAWVKKWPEAHMIRYFSFLNDDAVLVVSPEAHKAVLQTNCYAFVKPAWYRRLIFPLVGRGLVFLYGEDHRVHRKVLNGAFALANLKKLIPLMEEKAVEVCSTFDSEVNYSQGIINLTPTLSRITLDMITTTVLGVTLATLETAVPFHQIYQTVFDPTPWGTALSAIDSIVPIRWISVGENSRFNGAIAQLHWIMREVIRQRVAEVAAEKAGGDGGSRDLLTRMVQESNNMGLNWTEDDLLGHVLTLLAAGHETTSNSISWAIHYLALRHDIQDRLREEVLAMGDRPSIDYTTIESMRLLDNLYYEVLRLRSGATFATREAARDIDICGTTVPKGTSLMIMPCAIHFNPLIWGPRAEEFDPDRWDSLSGEAAKPHSFATFGMGPRGCPGKVYTRLEFKTVIMALARQFRFYEVKIEGEVPLVNPSVVMRPKGGLRVFVQRIGAGEKEAAHVMDSSEGGLL